MAAALPGGRAADVVAFIHCDDSTHGCAPAGQPGDACNDGWPCDQGLTCKVPGEVCVAD